MCSHGNSAFPGNGWFVGLEGKAGEGPARLWKLVRPTIHASSRRPEWASLSVGSPLPQAPEPLPRAPRSQLTLTALNLSSLPLHQQKIVF